MAVVSMKQLLEAGVHFGHQTRRWNPKMAKYIFTERNGIYIIDLQKTVKKLDEAYNFVRDVAADGGEILFVGTKKQAQESIRDEATRCGMHYVNARWLGGMMTNFRTIRKRIDRMEQLKLTLLAFQHSISHSAGDQLDSADSVVVAGDDVIDLIGIAVGINDSNNGDVQLASFGNSDALLVRVNNEHSLRQGLHVLNAAQVLVQLS